MDPDKAPIFVVGNGRSGTTLLRLMLCAHPRIYINHESAFYMWEASFPKKVPRRQYVEAYLKSRTCRWFAIDPERVLAQLPDPLPREQVKDAYVAIMREKAALYGRPRFGDKTPGHAWCLEPIYRDFPDARVIRIVRDPRSNVESLTRMPFASQSVLACAYMLHEEHKHAAPFADRMLTIRLEDLLADGRATMGRCSTSSASPGTTPSSITRTTSPTTPTCRRTRGSRARLASARRRRRSGCRCRRRRSG
jgi:hypothetical protein